MLKNMRKYRVLIIVLLFIAAAVFSGCGGKEQKAQELHRKAETLVTQGEEARRKGDYQKTLDSFVKASVLMDRIASDYPETTDGWLIKRGDAKVGPYSLNALNDKVIPDAKFRADASRDLLAMALFAVKRINNDSQRVDALAEIAGEYYRRGNSEKALKILEQADGLVDGLSNPYRLPAFVKDYRNPPGAVAYGYAKNGKLEEGLERADKIEDPFHREKARIDIAALYLERGEKGGRETAEKILAQTIKDGDKIIDILDRVFAMCYAADVYKAMGDKAGADKALKAALDSGEKMQGPENIIFSLLEIAGRYYEMGDKKKAEELLSRAVKTIDKIKDPEQRPVEFYLIARKYAQLGEFKKALEISGKLGSDSEKAKTLVSIAEKLREADKAQEAGKLLDEALTISRKIKAPSARALALSSTALEFTELKEDKKAQEIMAEALNAAGEIKEPHNRDFAMGEIAVKMAGAGRTGEAEKLLGTMESEDEKDQVYSETAKKQADRGETADSLETISRMRDHYGIIRNLIYLAGKMPPAGQKIDSRGKKILQDLVKKLDL